MPRIRTLKPEITASESLGRVSRDARLCFILLMTQADDHGRFRGHSRALASFLFPYDDDAPGLIEGWLSELEREGCIRRYEVDENHYIDIPKWLDHQKIDRPSPSKLPPFASPREPSRTLAPRARAPDLDLDLEKDRPDAQEGISPPIADEMPPMPEFLRKSGSAESMIATPLPAGAPSDDAPTKRRGTQLAVGWQPDERDCAFAIEHGWSDAARVRSEAEQFRAHHEAKGTVSKSWRASWRTWVLNGVKFEARDRRSATTAGNRPGAGSIVEATLGALAHFDRRERDGQ